MTLSAHKKFLVNVIPAEEDGVLLTIHGEIPIKRGELISHNQLGEASVMPREYYERNYIEVKKIKKQSIFAETYAQAWNEFSLESSFEDQDYITTTKELHKNENN